MHNKYNNYMFVMTNQTYMLLVSAHAKRYPYQVLASQSSRWCVIWTLRADNHIRKAYKSFSLDGLVQPIYI